MTSEADSLAGGVGSGAGFGDRVAGAGGATPGAAPTATRRRGDVHS
ncbi:MAG: hypothetical protein OXI83_10185 [Gemmatimonadota bacterium]|nr:hypothetical protein [Gemmatimonadota bacterium]